MSERIWTSEWPENEGWYWFYGTTYNQTKPAFWPVRVIRISNGVVRILDGNFMYRSEGHVGLFAPLDTPPPPDADNVIELGVKNG